jgi:hypothetical protein
VLLVRSPIEAWNFLFRTPAAFLEQKPEEPFLVDLKAEKARIRLRIASLGHADPMDPDRLAAAREADYRIEGAAGAAVSGQGARRQVRSHAGERVRTVLLVLDGPRLYELFLDADDEETAASLEEVARGFTILDPKGVPEGKGPPPGKELEERVLEDDYRRLEVFKPRGFSANEGNPNEDPGIWMEMRRIDEDRSQCDIRIRSHLKKTLQGQTVEDLARKAIGRFEKAHIDVRAPRTPPRSGWPGASAAYRLKLAGRTKNGVTVQEDCRLVDHENGRIYEFQVTMYGGAARSFEKEIAAFWKRLKITSK